MIIGSYQLKDWILNSSAEPLRYSTTSTNRVDASVILTREYVDHPIYGWAWRPKFHHELSFSMIYLTIVMDNIFMVRKTAPRM
jgi:hypothetical protein